MPMSPQMMPNQPALLMPPSSPSSSPHMMSSSPRHNMQQSSGNIKRQRSPSPSRSPFNQANLMNSQFLFSQSHLMQQRPISPCGIIASSPPPTNFSSPSSSKKVRNHNVTQSPQSMGARHQQSQSAFNSYLNRPGMGSFQSPSAQKGPMPAQTPPGSGSYQLPRGMPPQSQPSNMPPISGFNHHYLNSLSQEQAKMLLQSQQFMPQSSYLGNMSNIPMISAAAIAAVAAASGNSHQPPSSNSGSGGGSIMTGYSVRNPPNQ